jgi:hypothetical protein
VGRVVDPRTNHDDVGALLRDGDTVAVLRDDFHDERAADLVVSGREETPVLLVEAQVHVDVSVVGLELHVLHDA